ncbi:MAG: 2-oxoacid:acceptor oxidoreductase subunit alpha [Candidatus Aenigmatarchaeota archaeon]
MTKLVWLIGGEAGFGVREAGLIFAKTCTHAGFNIFGHVEYPSLIRGGHNTYQVSVDDEVFCQSKNVDIIVALNKETIDKHTNELSKGGAIIYDSGSMTKDVEKTNALFYPVPLKQLVTETGGKDIVRNTVAIGASCAVVGLDFSFVKDSLSEEFKSKGAEIVEMNVKAAKAGYDYIKKNFKNEFAFTLKPKNREEKIVLTGNDAIGIGAVKAGCNFYAGYPMTPVTSLMQFFAAHAKDYEIVFRNSADEIEAINMAIGASYAGAKSMTASSGGGYALMVEAIGMAAMTEIPVVIVEGTRTGPSTGLPTWTEQGDLRFVLHSSHGEFPRIVVAPGDVEECYYKTIETFNLAYKYQVPAVILTDRQLGESHMSTDKFETDAKNDKFVMDDNDAKNDYKRFAFTESGLSPRSVPGQKNGLYVANSYEHDETGVYAEDADNTKKMKDKRMKKLELILKEIPEPVLHGEKNSDITLIAWGSTKLPALQAIKILNEQKISANVLQIVYMEPFKSEAVAKILNNAKKLLIVENNQTAQLAGLIREKTGIEIKEKLLKYNGRQFFAEEIADKAKEMLKR